MGVGHAAAVVTLSGQILQSLGSQNARTHDDDDDDDDARTRFDDNIIGTHTFKFARTNRRCEESVEPVKDLPPPLELDRRTGKVLPCLTLSGRMSGNSLRNICNCLALMTKSGALNWYGTFHPRGPNLSRSCTRGRRRAKE